MANNKNEKKSEPTDPREAVEAIGKEMYETLSRGFSDAFGFLQDLSSAIEDRIEEAFGKPGGSASKKSGATNATSKPAPAAKKAAAKKAPAKKAPAKKKAAAKKAPAKKKAAAKKAPAKKKAAAKKAPAKKKAAASGPTRDELYAEAQKLDIDGRSSMSKAQLQRAIKAAKK